jgi:hypothetical protein
MYYDFCFLLGAHFFQVLFRRRPYRVEYTGSLPTSEVTRHRARLVLGWGTAWEHPRVLSAFCIRLLIWHSQRNALAALLLAPSITRLIAHVLFSSSPMRSNVSSAFHWGPLCDIDSWRRPRLPYPLGASSQSALERPQRTQQGLSNLNDEERPE